jgi:hypothetical protein
MTARRWLCTAAWCAATAAHHIAAATVSQPIALDIGALDDPRAWAALASWGPDCAWIGAAPENLQHAVDGCGPAALAVFLRTAGRSVPQDVIWSACRMPGGGTTLGCLAKAARAFGVPVQTRMVADLAALDLPAIVHLQRGHFVVLERFTAAVAEITDPACGRIRLRAAALRGAASGAVLVRSAGTGCTLRASGGCP